MLVSETVQLRFAISASSGWGRRMLFQRFIIVCLFSMVIGILLALLVQTSRANGARVEGVFHPCSIHLHPACGRITS
jgi:hypothetical protein